MTIRDLRICDDVWDAAAPLRRADWRANIDDLVVDARLLPPYTDRYLLVTPGDDATEIEFLDDDGVVAERVIIPHAATAEELDEYLDVIRRMDAEAHRRDLLEALDMGKKVVHDAAAMALARAVPGLAEDHRTYRKLFTLLVALRVDTTNLAHARGHGFR